MDGAGLGSVMKKCLDPSGMYYLLKLGWFYFVICIDVICSLWVVCCVVFVFWGWLVLFVCFL